MESKKSESLDSSLVRTISESDLADVAVDAVDAALDDLPVPIFSTLRKLYRGTRSVHHYFYVKKVIRYLTELQSIPSNERRGQLSKLLRADERQKFGEHVALVLDRLNDLDKARLMGLVTRAFIEERITFDQLRSLNFLIDAIDPRLIDSIKVVGNSVRTSYLNEDEQILLSYGLLTVDLSLETESIGIGGFNQYTSDSMSFIKGVRVTYSATKLANLFCQICLTEDKFV